MISVEADRVDLLVFDIGATLDQPRDQTVDATREAALAVLRSTEADRSELAAYRGETIASGEGGEDRAARVTEAVLNLVELRQANERLTLKSQGDDAVLSMTVSRLGGLVEGRPTARLNFLQRVDELREIERKYADGIGRDR